MGPLAERCHRKSTGRACGRAPVQRARWRPWWSISHIYIYILNYYNLQQMYVTSVQYIFIIYKYIYIIIYIAYMGPEPQPGISAMDNMFQKRQSAPECPEQMQKLLHLQVNCI